MGIPDFLILGLIGLSLGFFVSSGAAALMIGLGIIPRYAVSPAPPELSNGMKTAVSLEFSWAASRVCMMYRYRWGHRLLPSMDCFPGFSWEAG